MRFEHERPGDFKIFLDQEDLSFLTGQGGQYTPYVRGGLEGRMWSKTSICIDGNDLDRVEFDPGLHMTVILTFNDIFPVEIAREMLDPGGFLPERKQIIQHFFGDTGTVIVDLEEGVTV